MIAYHILCHDNFPQVAKLIDALYNTEDVFLIDIDDGGAPNTTAIERFVSRENVHITRDRNIGWGGAGTLRKTIRGAFFLLDADKRWDYYVTLSGQDLPLQSPDAIKSRLSEGLSDNISYIRAFEHKPERLEDHEVFNTTAKIRQWGDRGHTKIFGKPGTIHPKAMTAVRWLVDVTEVGEKGEVYVGSCDPLLLRRRQDFFSRHAFHLGANWFNLNRVMLEYMRDDPFAYELFDVLRTTFIPDECYFQTYIKNSPFRDKTSKEYGRLILRPGPVPRVKVFDMGDWPIIESSSELFGRKFDVNHDSEIVDSVLARVA